MSMVDHVTVQEDIDIDGIILEKGDYQTKDLYFIDPGEGIYAHFANDYVVTEDKNLKLKVDDFVLSKIPQKHRDRLHLKPNGIINICQYKPFRDYRLVLENGVITKLYRADNENDIKKYPEEIQRNYDAEWK